MENIDIIHPIVAIMPNRTLGITFRFNSKSRVVSIAKVAKESPFYGVLPEGYSLLAVDGYSSFANLGDALKALKACQTTVTITAVSIPIPAGFFSETRIMRPSPSDIRFDSTQTNLVRVANVSMPGSFATSPIREGDIILTINNQIVSNPALAAHLLHEAGDDCSIVYAPLVSLHWHAIHDAVALQKAAVNNFQAVIPRKTYHLIISRPDGVRPQGKDFNYEVTFVDYYNFQFHEKWTRMKAETDAGRRFAHNELDYGHKFQTYGLPYEKAVNESMSSNLRRLDNLVRAHTSQGTPDTTIVESLGKLMEYKSKNLLTDEEFRAAKAKVLGLVNHEELMEAKVLSVAC